MKKIVAADRASILVRIPLDCKAFLEKVADYHCSSQSAVVVQILRAAMEADRREARASGAAS
jgi:hypothetical protein